ncbi:MAG TPA: recombinase family protein [Acidimicrobiales bacterium]|nr:recombinase family protein [Acidimicrobiales bacterium]
MAAAVYVRISEDTRGTRLGVARQEADCRQLADRLGWPVANVYCDNDISAFSSKERPAYRRLLADLAAGVVDALVVWHPDRLHRSPLELEEFISVVEATGAQVQSVTAGERDLTTPTGRLHARIEGAVARHESEHKSQRIRRKHLELAETGAVSGGGRRPFGYEGDRRTIRPDEAELIRRAAADVMAGASIRSIATRWNEQGVPTVTGVAWSPTTVKRLLGSARIAGQREHHGQVTALATWPGIITPSESMRLRSLLGDAARQKYSNGTARTYLLSGFTHCGGCGRRLTARAVMRKGHRYPRLTCVKDRGGCNRVGIGVAGLDALITEAVLQRLDSVPLHDALRRRSEADLRSTELERAIADDEAALEELTRDRYVDRTITAAMFAAARAPLERRLADARARLGALTVTSAVALPAGRVLRQRWPDLDLEHRRAVLEQVIERIYIAPTTRDNNRFDPSRVDVRWKV